MTERMSMPELVELKKLKVMQLKALLTEHELSPSGLKADLIDRLHRYALEVQAGPESTDAVNADNLG